MDDFTKVVQRCAKNLENYTIFNSSTNHAIILIQNLLEVAARDREPVKLFSGGFGVAVYASLLEPLRKVIAARVELTLISELAPDADNEFVNTARAANARIVTIGRKTGFPHFVLVGNKSYRVESDDALRTARANFNDPTSAAALLSIYHKLIPQETAAG